MDFSLHFGIFKLSIMYFKSSKSEIENMGWRSFKRIFNTTYVRVLYLIMFKVLVYLQMVLLRFSKFY
jgi:hypothetical protein